MTAKEKIESLTAAANAKTGKGDTDLTAATKSLIDGYGQGQGGFDMTVTDEQLKMLVYVPTWNREFITRFALTEIGQCDIDWGDGTVDTVDVGTNLEYAGQNSHTYAMSGQYLITLTPKAGHITFGGVNAHMTLSEGRLITGVYMNANIQLRKAFSSRVRNIAAGKNTICNSGFSNFQVSILTNIYTGLYQNTTITEVIIPEGVENLRTYFANNATIEYISFPKSLLTISNNAFDNCSATSIFDFTKIELVDGELPVSISATNVFRGISGYIVFATDDIADVAKNSTNWSVYADKIKSRSEIAW